MFVSGGVHPGFGPGTAPREHTRVCLSWVNTTVIGQLLQLATILGMEMLNVDQLAALSARSRCSACICIRALNITASVPDTPDGCLPLWCLMSVCVNMFCFKALTSLS